MPRKTTGTSSGITQPATPSSSPNSTWTSSNWNSSSSPRKGTSSLGHSRGAQGGLSSLSLSLSDSGPSSSSTVSSSDSGSSSGEEQDNPSGPRPTRLSENTQHSGDEECSPPVSPTSSKSDEELSEAYKWKRRQGSPGRSNSSSTFFIGRRDSHTDLSRTFSLPVSGENTIEDAGSTSSSSHGSERSLHTGFSAPVTIPGSANRNHVEEDGNLSSEDWDGYGSYESPLIGKTPSAVASLSQLELFFTTHNGSEQVGPPPSYRAPSPPTSRRLSPEKKLEIDLKLPSLR